MIAFTTRVLFALTLVYFANIVNGQACPRPSLTKREIYDGTTRANAWEITGLGGRYAYLSQYFLSKDNIIESDHFPPKSAYKNAKDLRIRNIPEKDMAAVSVSSSFHDNFFTTKNNVRSQRLMEQYFRDGNYYAAIDQNIEWYVTNPDRSTGTSRQGNIHLIREGIIGGLQIHVRNKLLSEQESNRLICKYSLNSYRVAISNLVNSDRRESARLHIQCNTNKYKGPK